MNYATYMIFTRFESDFHSVRVVLTLFTLLKSNHFTLFTLREYTILSAEDSKNSILSALDSEKKNKQTNKQKLNKARQTNKQKQNKTQSYQQ